MFPLKPLFAEHTLRAGTMGRAGLIDQASLRIQADGLYAEADVENNPFGDYVLNLIDAMRGYWSAGTMPHMMNVRADGLVTLFPIVEGSVVSNPSSPLGTTAVKHLRSIMSIEGDDEMPLARSFWVPTVPYRAWGDIQPQAPAPAPAAPAPVAPPPPAPAPAPDAMLQILQRIDTRMTALEDNANLRTGPQGNPLAGVNQPVPQITVSSKYDGYNLFTLLFYDEALRRIAAKDGRKAWKNDDEYNMFLRAVGTQIERIHTDEDSRNVPAHLRSMDSIMLDAWRAKGMKNLRSAELMTATLAGSGDELVPTSLSSVAYYSIMLQSRVASLFETITMPTNPYDYPTISAGLAFRRVLEPTDQSQSNLGSSVFPASKPVTAKKTFNALEYGMGAMVMVSMNLFTDAGLSVADVLGTEWTRRQAAALDYLLLNGDERATTSNISHYGTDPTGTAYDKILLLDGIRVNADANSDTRDGATLASVDFPGNQALMGTRGIIGTDIANLVHIIDPGTWYKLTALSDFATMNQVGDTAALLTGQVARVYGVPIIVSDDVEWMTDSLNRIPAAHNIAAGTDAGSIITVHRGIPKIGRLRDIPMEAGPVPHTGLFALSGSVRLDLQFMEAGGTAVSYGVAV